VYELANSISQTIRELFPAGQAMDPHAWWRFAVFYVTVGGAWASFVAAGNRPRRAALHRAA
jgi:hypothetical protein